MKEREEEEEEGKRSGQNVGPADRCVYWGRVCGGCMVWYGAGRGQTVYVVFRQAVIFCIV